MIAHRLFLTAAIVALTSPIVAIAQTTTVVATDRGQVRGAQAAYRIGIRDRQG